MEQGLPLPPALEESGPVELPKNHHPCNHPCYNAPANQIAAQNGEVCE
jgi:hypothetical protein